MNAGLLAAGALGLFLLAYRFYGRFLDKHLFQLDPKKSTPSHTRQDNVDFCPTRPLVLFGHHFASICGLGPIIGPALAAIWGWLPAFLWIIFGAVFIGAAHDFGSLILSARYEGRSIGDLTGDIIGPRARLLFLVIIFFMIALAMGLFASVIATLFAPSYYPQAVIPSGLLIVIAIVLGQVVFKRGGRLGPATALGLLLMFGSLWVGAKLPVTGPSPTTWIFILLIYSFTASCLPVWVLLQPRDYLNSFMLYTGIALMYLGLFILQPTFVAPAINRSATDLPALFPFLFITVACGAVSGFHSLVCSGTTSKQLDKESDAKAIGYGGMLMEGALAVIVLFACTAGVASTEVWHSHYSGWAAMKGLGPSLGMFIEGAARFISQVGLSLEISRVLISVVVVGFALTTLDSATRLLRYNIEELGRTLHITPITNRYAASGLAVLAIGYFALMPSAKSLWQLFGTTNQLLAGLALLAITTYLFKRGRPTFFYAAPMLFMFATTVTAMGLKLKEFAKGGNNQLFIVSLVILGLAGWLVVEAAIDYFASHRNRGKTIGAQG